MMSDRAFRALTVVLAIAAIASLAASVVQWSQCDGAFVRGFIWWECIAE